MSDAVISALVTGVLAIVAEVIISKRQTDKTIAVMEAQEEGRNALLAEKLKNIHSEITTLSDRQDKHNKVIDRTYALEAEVKLIKAEDTRQNARLAALENKPQS